MPKKIFDILVVGSGLSGLTFAEEYLKKNRTLNFISPTLKKDTNDNTKHKLDYKSLPPQFKKNFNKIEDFFDYNKFKFDKKNCSLLGSLEFGGLSNYWGLQIDKDIDEDLDCFGKKAKNQIINCFYEILKDKSLKGKFKNFNNDFKINNFYENFLNKKSNYSKKLIVEKSILALSAIKAKKEKKLVPRLIYNNLKNRVKIHNYFVEKIKKEQNFIRLYCSNKKIKKEFLTKKLVLAAGTLATTKLVMEYLKIKNEVPIKHHPRLISVYFARNKISSNLDLTPGLFQIKNKKNGNIFSGDIRPANEMILYMSLKIYSLFKPLKFILLFFKNHILFSNNLLGSKFSNLYIKKEKGNFLIFSKKEKTLKILKKKQKIIYNFLRTNKIVFPFFKNFFPGIGADYHYFGTIPIGKKKLSVNRNCQLKNDKSIFIVDGSVLNFKKNLYPFGFVMANAKRIAKLF